MALEPIGISPRVDCVFRALMGDPRRVGILIDFLTAVLGEEIAAVQIKNPIHLPDFIGDDFTIVDVEATDTNGRIYQVEMQTTNEANLRLRILYTWADLFEGQLDSGQGYGDLKPVVSIWLLNHNLFRSASTFHHRFVPHDPAAGTTLSTHMQIHVLELARWRAQPHDATPSPKKLEGWVAFFAEAEQWTDIPEHLRTRPLEEAMEVLNEFKKNAVWSSVYRSRLDTDRRRITQEKAFAQALADKEEAEAAREVERAAKDAALAAKEQERAAKEQERAAKEQERAAKEQERAAKEQERAAKDAALAEVERLRALLAQRG